MNYAKVLKFDNSIEEEVLLEINGFQFIGFIIVWPYKVFVNKIYPVEISVEKDDLEFFELDEPRYGLERINAAYGYMLYGKVCGDKIDIGNNVLIHDDMFNEYTYLNGKYIKLKVDSLNVEFLETSLNVVN